MIKYGNREYDVRISEKVTLSIYEAAAYTGIGLRTLSRLSDDPNCDFILMVGPKISALEPIQIQPQAVLRFRAVR